MIDCPFCDFHGRIFRERLYILRTGLGNFKEYEGIVLKAIDRANLLLNDSDFVAWICSLEEFELSRDIDGTGINGKELVQLMLAVRRTVSVKAYSWGSSNAKFKSKYPNRININRKYVRRLDRTYGGSEKGRKDLEKQLAGTIIHEYFHALDRVYSFIYLGHGSNSPKGKDETVCYKIGNRAKEWHLPELDDVA